MNYLSRPYQTEQPVDMGGNLQIAMGVATNLQSRYDANKSLIDQTIAQYEGLRGLTDTDNEYIASQVSNIKNQVNRLGSLNLAHNTGRDSILNNLKSVLKDPIIQNILVSKANKDNLDSEYQKIAQKDPLKANEANYSYALYQGGYFDYMQGKTKKVSAMKYTPFNDNAEEHLKKLKTIKDIRGKRFIETVDPNNPGQIIRKEIDGLEDVEIRQYLGGMMSPQELSQLKINAWYKNGAQNIETNRANIITQYQEYNNRQVGNYTQNLEQYNAIINSSLPESQKEKARLAVRTTEETIEDLRSIDYSKLDTTSIAFNMERSNYINSMSQMAKSEWSQSLEKNDVYYADQSLDIQRQNLEINQAKLALAYQKENLGADGQLQQQRIVSSSPMDTALAKTLEEDGVGTFTLKKDHDLAYRQSLNEASNIVNNSSKEDEDLIKQTLLKRGIIVQPNGSFVFQNPESNKNNSLVNSVYEGLKEIGKVTPELTANYLTKQETAKNLLTVRKEGYSQVFNEAPDKYVKSFDRMQRDISIMAQGEDLWTGEDKKELIDLKNRTDDFIKKAGGIRNLKQYLTDNPNVLTEFAELTDILDKTNKGIGAFSAKAWIVPVDSEYGITYIDQNLKKDAGEAIEKEIKKRTDEGTMFSAYNAYNIVDDKVKEDILKQVQTGVGSGVMNVTGGTPSETTLSFDPKLNLTVRKYGDEVFIEQSQKGSKDTGMVQLRYAINKASSMYGELSKYIQLDKPTAKMYFSASKDFSSKEIKLKYPDYKNSPDFDNLRYKVEREISPYLDSNTFFSVVNGNAGILSAQDGVEQVLDTFQKNYKMDVQEIEILKQKIKENLPFYKTELVSKRNEKRNRFEFYLNVIDTRDGGKNIPSLDVALPVDKMDYGLYHSIENYPQVFIMNRLMRDITINASNRESIGKIINNAFPTR